MQTKNNSIDTIDLFPIIDQELISLLIHLKPDDWSKPTISPKWNIKDIALHLLDGNIRGISTGRDKHFANPDFKPGSEAELITYINQLNNTWVAATQRISNQLLIHLLETTNAQYFDYLKNLPLEEAAIFAVSWAGETHSTNWFHIAREYTEKFHHQLQIRQAVGLEAPLLVPKLYLPFLKTIMYALPYQYHSVDAPEGTIIEVQISEGFGSWFIEKQHQGWVFISSKDLNPDSKIVIDYRMAWRLFTKGISKNEVQKYIQFYGNEELGSKILGITAIVG